MKKALFFFFLFSAFGVFSQQTQWRSSITPSQFADNPFVKEFGSTNLAVIYLDVQLTGEKQIVIAAIDKCGNSGNQIKLGSINFKPEWLLDAVTDGSGNLYVCGLLNNRQPDGTLFIIKVNPAMQVVWTRTYTGHKIHPYVFDINTNGELFIMFNTTDATHGNGLLKLNSSGQIIWAKSYGFYPIWGRGGATKDGGFLHSTGSVFFKTDKHGNMEWRNILPTAYVITKIAELNDGYMFYQGSYGGQNRSRVVMLNKNGSVRWHSDELSDFTATEVTLLSNQEVLFAGFGNSNQPGAPSNYGLCLLKVDASGNIGYKKLLSDGSSQLHANNLDVLHTNQNETYLLEYAASGALADVLMLTKLPQDWDSLSCYNAYTLADEIPLNLTANTQALIPSSIMNFNTNNVTVSAGSSSAVNMNQLCNITGKGEDFNLGNDTTLCPGDFLTLSGPTGYSYLWSTGSTAKSITVTQAGWYRLEASFGCDPTMYRDSIFVDYFPQLNLDLLLNKENYYVGDTLIAEVRGGSSFNYTWYLNNIEIPSSNQLEYLLKKEGTYTIRVVYTDDYGCTHGTEQTFTVQTKIPFAPNVFTPNGDGTNEQFKLLNAENIPYTLQIFNRYGTLIATVDNSGWDGNTNLGQPAAQGVYYFVAKWHPTRAPIKGHVTLVR